MKCLFFLLLMVLFSSCNKREAHPELSDEVYKDLVIELDIFTKALEDETKNLKSLEQEKLKAVPQTGQIKFAVKKTTDSENKINTLRQQKQYFEIKLEQRKFLVAQRYEESFREGGRPWPDKEEIATYKAVNRFQHNRLAGQHKKEVKKDVPRGTEKKESGGH